jgi:glutamine amidotransferase-like uncharacterized protein
LHSYLAVVCVFAIACKGDRPPASILLFDGRGTSRGDVAAIERILRDAHLAYATASSRQLNAMSAPQLSAYRLLIVPGGDFEQIGYGLTPAAAANVRTAVRGGLNYLGLCAGAFFAGNSPYNGLDLTPGVRFPFYAAEARGVRKAAVEVAIAGAQTLEQYWEDGPQLSGWGDVFAKYADGTPAGVQGRFGSGFVVLLGTHPEAPDSWRDALHFRTRGNASRQYASTVIAAALHGAALPHY